MSTADVLLTYIAVVATLILLLLLAWARALRLRGAGLLQSPGPAGLGPLESVGYLPSHGLQVGMPAPPPPVTSEGDVLNPEQPAGRYLIGFFSAGCAGCRRSLDRFVPAASAFAASGRVIAVVSGEAGHGDDIAERVRPFATVITEDDHGPITLRYRVTAFPYFVLVSHAVVVFGGSSAAELARSLVDS